MLEDTAMSLIPPHDDFRFLVFEGSPAVAQPFLCNFARVFCCHPRVLAASVDGVGWLAVKPAAWGVPEDEIKSYAQDHGVQYHSKDTFKALLKALRLRQKHQPPAEACILPDLLRENGPILRLQSAGQSPSEPDPIALVRAYGLQVVFLQVGVISDHRYAHVRILDPDGEPIRDHRTLRKFCDPQVYQQYHFSSAWVLGGQESSGWNDFFALGYGFGDDLKSFIEKWLRSKVNADMQHLSEDLYQEAVFAVASRFHHWLAYLTMNGYIWLVSTQTALKLLARERHWMKSHSPLPDTVQARAAESGEVEMQECLDFLMANLSRSGRNDLIKSLTGDKSHPSKATEQEVRKLLHRQA
jgi:hypothetical protein